MSQNLMSQSPDTRNVSIVLRPNTRFSIKPYSIHTIGGLEFALCPFAYPSTAARGYSVTHTGVNAYEVSSGLEVIGYGMSYGEGTSCPTREEAEETILARLRERIECVRHVLTTSTEEQRAAARFIDIRKIAPGTVSVSLTRN
jgi:hypothetical protein